MCEPQQLAICRVRDGKPEAQCIDPPRVHGPMTEKQHQLQLLNWVLSVVTESPRSSNQRLSVADRQIVTTGVYYDPQSGHRVTFKLPKKTGSAQAPASSTVG